MQDIELQEEQAMLEKKKGLELKKQTSKYIIKVKVKENEKTGEPVSMNYNQEKVEPSKQEI